jgi:hypothetical protein
MGFTTLPLNSGKCYSLPKGEEDHEAAGVHHARWWRSSGMAGRCAGEGSAHRHSLASLPVTEMTETGGEPLLRVCPDTLGRITKFSKHEPN